jgi:GT2 family glycosyltransferase
VVADTGTGRGAVRELDILVVAYGAPELLDGCLAALEGAFPVVVVDNSSNDAVHEVAVAHRASYVDPGRNLGFGAGVNVGLDCRPGHGDVLLLNPDAVISAQGVAELAHVLHSADDIAAVAPVQEVPDSGEPARVAWPFPSPGGAWVEALGFGFLRTSPDFVIGSVLLLRAEALEEVGRFDEDFFLYAEEIDWQRRAATSGWRSVLCAGVVATHVGAGTGGDSRVREIHFQASHERYIRKHFGTRGWWSYRTATMVGAAMRALVLPGDRGRAAANRLHLFRKGPLLVEAGLDGDTDQP